VEGSVTSVNIRVLPAVLSLLVTLIVLFGGYFAYQWFQIEKPLKNAIDSTPHVTLEELRVDPDQIRIQLKADENFSFVEDYFPLRKRVHSLAAGRKVNIELKDRTDSVLEKAWNEMVFGVTEAVVQRDYTQIPETVETVAKNAKIRHEVAMDEQFVYVALHHQDHSLYRVLSLEPSKGVKANG
jgi:hypothetical protein